MKAKQKEQKKPTVSTYAGGEFSLLAETLPQFVWITREDGFLVFWNQRFADYLQATPEQLQGYGWRQFLHPEELKHVLAVRRHSLETGDPYEITYRLRNGRTGAYHWFLTRAMPMRDKTGQIIEWLGTSTDIDEQKQIEEALRQSQERASLLMNSSILGIFLTEGSQIIEANETFLRMTGYNREDMQQGRVNWISIMLPAPTSLHQRAHQECSIQQYTTPFEAELLCKDGSHLPVLLGGIAFHTRVCQGIGFALDNSARQELERRKDDFLSIASHEFKTPLTALKLQSQMVRKHLLRHGHHEMAATFSRVEEPFRRLERLVGELLDVSKIQTGRFEHLQESVDLNLLLQEVADTLQHMSNTHAIVIHGTAPSSLIGDKGRLEQVFINLLSNAIKYAPDAPLIKVEVSSSAETVTISVRDYGIGIPQELHKKIFERFYRASDISRRAVPGLGMGLYIVAEIVNRHRGCITVDSEVGKGSTFSVTFPLEGPMKAA